MWKWIRDTGVVGAVFAAVVCSYVLAWYLTDQGWRMKIAQLPTVVEAAIKPAEAEPAPPKRHGNCVPELWAIGLCRN